METVKKKVQTSYSGIKKFTTCAKQFYEIKVVGNFVEPDTTATLYGKEVHTALENYAKGEPLPALYKQFQKWVDQILTIPGVRLIEQKFALDHDGNPCEFDSPNYYLRGIADLVIIADDTAYVVDWKTGNDKYMDLKQLHLMAIFVFIHFPAVRHIKSGLMFLLKGNFVPADDYARDDLPTLLESFRDDLNSMQKAFDTDTWPAKPSGLCKKHCVVESCQHNGRYQAF